MFYFRVVTTGGGFECRRGRDVFATFLTAEAALEHCRREAKRHLPSAVYLHDAAGGVQLVAEFTADGAE